MNLEKKFFQYIYLADARGTSYISAVTCVEMKQIGELHQDLSLPGSSSGFGAHKGKGRVSVVKLRATKIITTPMTVLLLEIMISHIWRNAVKRVIFAEILVLGLVTVYTICMT